MTRVRHRLTLDLDFETKVAIRRLARSTDSSQSSVVTACIQAYLPELARLCKEQGLILNKDTRRWKKKQRRRRIARESMQRRRAYDKLNAKIETLQKILDSKN